MAFLKSRRHNGKEGASLGSDVATHLRMVALAGSLIGSITRQGRAEPAVSLVKEGEVAATGILPTSGSSPLSTFELLASSCAAVQPEELLLACSVVVPANGSEVDARTPETFSIGNLDEIAAIVVYRIARHHHSAVCLADVWTAPYRLDDRGHAVWQHDSKAINHRVKLFGIEHPPPILSWALKAMDVVGQYVGIATLPSDSTAAHLERSAGADAALSFLSALRGSRGPHLP